MPSTVTSYPTTLSGLTAREEITDTLYRALLGLDTNNRSLWESAWSEDPDISFTLGPISAKGKADLNAKCLARIGPLDTQHTLSVVRVDVKDSADTAFLTANAVNQHFAANEGLSGTDNHYMSGSTNEVVMVKENGSWKIKKWVVKVIWSSGNRAIVAPKS